jgi:hypothetical protein
MRRLSRAANKRKITKGNNEGSETIETIEEMGFGVLCVFWVCVFVLEEERWFTSHSN